MKSQLLLLPLPPFQNVFKIRGKLSGQIEAEFKKGNLVCVDVYLVTHMFEDKTGQKKNTSSNLTLSLPYYCGGFFLS